MTVLLAVTAWFFFPGISEGHSAAIKHAKAFISEEYGVDVDEIKVDNLEYGEDENRFALILEDTKADKLYEIALRLDEENEVSFILDVTGQFDEFGLAYCH